MTHNLYKPALAATLIVLFNTPEYADVSREGYYISLVIIFGVLFLPVIILALSHRTRNKLYLTALFLYGAATFASLWLINPSQNNFILALAVSYIILVIYFIKEKKTA